MLWSKLTGQSTRLNKIEQPKLSGELKDYPSFRDNRKNIVETELKNVNQRFKIKNKVPQHDQRNISNISSLKDIGLTWTKSMESCLSWL